MATPSTAAPALRWNFDIDQYLSPLVAPSFVHRLPALPAHFLGYRTTPPRPLGNLVVCAWACCGILIGVSVVMLVDENVPAFRGPNNTPTTIGGVGSAAVLLLYAIESPLAQPRNAILAQAMSSFVGVSVAKLFGLGGPATFQTLRWLAGGVACALATAVMSVTGTVHPPAGAMVLVAVMDTNARQLGWKLIPAVLLDCMIMMTVALTVNNLGRRYPLYWWTPGEVGGFWERRRQKGQKRQKKQKEENHQQLRRHPSGVVFRTTSRAARELPAETESSERLQSGSSPETTRASTPAPSEDLEAALPEMAAGRILITPGMVTVPDDMYLRPEEKMVLENLSKRL